MITPPAIAWTLLALVALLWFVLWHRKFWSHHRATPRLGRARVGPGAPFVTVCVPARDEERYVGAAVRSLIAQDYPRFRVVVANDRSTDGTAAILDGIARDADPARLTVLHVPEPPEGWMGKCHALHRAVAAAPPETEFYLFTDADVIHRPDTLSRSVAQMMEERADLFAISPRVQCVGAWENALLPLFMQLGVIQIDPRHLNDPERKEIVGIGAFTLIRRSMYESWGGHRRIRGETIDDMAMGLLTKRAGGRLLLVRGGAAVRLRMYTSLQGIIAGFEKNMHTAVGGGWDRAVGGAIFFPLAHASPAIVAIAAALCGAWPLALAALALHAACAAVLVARTRHYLAIRPALVAIMYPAGALLAAYILLLSTYHARQRGVVRWRGREIKRPRQMTKLS